MTDRLNTYIPSLILSAVSEFVGAALIFILVCGKKQTQNHETVKSVEDGESRDQLSLMQRQEQL